MADSSVWPPARRPASSPITRRDAAVLLVLASLAAGAWAILWVDGSGSRWLDHEVSARTDLRVVPFLAAWFVMTIAMMLPTTAPLVLGFRRLVRQRSDRVGLVVVLLVMYLFVWTAFGLVALVGDRVVHAVVAVVPWLAAQPQLVTSAVLVGAGLAMLAPVTHHCLDQCRTPRGLLATGWHGRQPWLEAARIGLHHGILCLGCCWPLMVTMFALATGSLAWMLTAAAVMFAQKVAPWGDRLTTPVALVLVLAGVAALGGVA